MMKIFSGGGLTDSRHWASKMTRHRMFSSAISLLCVFLAPVAIASTVDAGTPLTENHALEVLTSRLSKDRVYEKWAPNLSCLLFATDKKTEGYFEFTIHEKHGGKCPGDPSTAPRVDSFRVNRSTREIQWYDLEGDLQPYGTFLKSRRPTER